MGFGCIIVQLTDTNLKTCMGGKHVEFKNLAPAKSCKMERFILNIKGNFANWKGHLVFFIQKWMRNYENVGLWRDFPFIFLEFFVFWERWNLTVDCLCEIINLFYSSLWSQVKRNNKTLKALWQRGMVFLHIDKNLFRVVFLDMELTMDLA